jgi:hypothetical protein
VNDDLLTLSDAEWWQYKANYCVNLYKRGLEYDSWTEQRAQWWLESLKFFVDEFIKPELPRPRFHDDWYLWSVLEQAYMNLSPRDHAKTTVHSINRVAWEICCNRNITFFIIFSTTDVAKLILSQIKSQLTQNPRIRAGFGVFNPMELPVEERRVDPDWSQFSITVNRPDFSIKDPTVAVAGALTNVLSRRVDRLIVDDLLTDKIAHSEAESERLNRWYFNDVQPVLKRDGQEIITGTRYRRGDFYDTIEALSKEKNGLYKVFIGDAIINEATQETLWPERWPYDALMRQRAKMGTVRFNRNYRNRIMSDEDSPFPMIWFTGGVDAGTGVYYRGCFAHDVVLGQVPAFVTSKRWLRLTVMGVDPAIGQSTDSKFFGCIVLGLDYQNRIVVADVVQEKLSFVAQKRLVVEMYQFWKPRHIVVESNAYQKALAEGLQDETFLPIVSWYTSGKNARQKPEIGVPAMDVYFETGRFLIPRGDSRSKELTDKLVEELHFWGKHNTSDLAMALWFAFERMRPEIERAGVLPPAKDMIFGDRLRREREMVRGAAGQLLPRRAALAVRRMAAQAPLAHMSPRARHRKKLPSRLIEEPTQDTPL